MNASLQKEMRLLLPAWGLALAAAVIPACLPKGMMPDLAVPCFAIGALLLALAPFGQEISLGTFSLLLSQPRARLALWRAKVTATAAAMFSVWVVLAILWTARTDGAAAGRNLVELCGLVALAVLAGAFWTTLLFRQSIAAFWASLILPWLLCALWPVEPRPGLGRIPAPAVALPLLVYAAAGFAFARWLFLRAQDLPWTGGVVSLERLRPGAWSFSLLTIQKRRRPWIALLQKELALQQVTIFLVPCLAMFHVLALAARVLNPEYAKKSLFISSVWILWLAAPFVIGGVALAEERKLGVMTGALCLPVRRFRQFFLKLGVVLVTGIILGAVAPWFFEDLGQLLGARNELLEWTGRPSLFFAAGAIATVSFFASSLARNSLYAMGTGFVMSVAVFLYLCGGGLHEPLSALYLGCPLLRETFGPATLVALVWPAYMNFRRIDLRFAWLSNLAVWLATFLVVMAASAGVYLRPWELVLPIEQPHGPARISPSPHLQFFSTYTRLFILLPDGRLWQCPMIFDNWNHSQPAVAAAGFLPGTNWLDFAANQHRALALRSDGSLWEIRENGWSRHETPNPLQRLGTASDWKSVAASHGGLMALNSRGILWKVKFGISDTLEQLDDDPTWLPPLCGANDNEIYAAKRDGSVWRWSVSWWATEPDKSVISSIYRWVGVAWVKEPFLPFRGTNWSSFMNSRLGPLGLDREGNIWTSDLAWKCLANEASHFQTIPPQLPVAAHPGWRALAGGRDVLARVDTSGRLWLQSLFENGDDRWNINPTLSLKARQTSKYSDWLAGSMLNESIIALAADGTLSSWHGPNGWESNYELLAPSRKQEWSINLFEPSR